MLYHELRPVPALGQFVECFWFAEGEGRNAPIETIVPDGCPELILQLGEPFRQWRPSGAERQPTAFLVGEMTRALRVQPEGRVGTMGIRFRPAGLRAFLRTPLHELTDRTTPIDALWGRAASTFEEAVAEAKGAAARVRLAEAFLLGCVANGPARDAAVEAAVGRILRERGQVRLAALGAAAGLSERQLERRFRTAVGLGPKGLSRLVRFQEVLRRLGGGEGAPLVEVALDCGYFDQSHLVHDFRELAGAAPTQYLGAESDLARRFADPSRLDRFFAQP
jgi:methylphosphotriester-DNA--protein-cysteine methyltransferase